MNNIKIKFDNGGTDVIVSLKGLLGEHKDLTRLKNPRLSLGMKDADGGGVRGMEGATNNKAGNQNTQKAKGGTGQQPN